MEIFKKKDKSVMASAPEISETPGEVRYVNDLSKDESPKNAEDKKTAKNVEYIEVPICLSQAQINNYIIENNMMLKQIISEINS